MSYSARKPYLKLKQSIVDLFQAPIRYLKESSTKESQFEKPYMDEDYQAMHLDLPTPDWPSWDFGWESGKEKVWAGSIPKKEEPLLPQEELPAMPTEDKPFAPCSFTFFQQDCAQIKEAGLDVEDTAVSCFKYPGNLPYSSANFWSFEGVGEYFVTNVSESFPMKREFADVSPQAASHALHFNWDTEKAALVEGCYVITTVCYNAPGICKHCIDIMDTNCCKECCPAETTFEFDDANTPDTIVAGDHISVYVSGGCPPFIFAVTGIGYTWHANGESSYETSGRIAQLDCADGECGVDYGAIAELTILDDCDTIVEATILNASGHWASHGGPACGNLPYTTHYYYQSTDVRTRLHYKEGGCWCANPLNACRDICNELDWKAAMGWDNGDLCGADCQRWEC